MEPPPIIHEDEAIIAVAKPAGIATANVPAGEESVFTVVRGLIAARRPNGHGLPFLGVVSRLDRPVSGVIVFAKTPVAAANLARQFRERSVEKTYVAAVEGRFPAPPGTWVEWHDALVRPRRGPSRPTSGATGDEAAEARIRARVVVRHGAAAPDPRPTRIPALPSRGRSALRRPAAVSGGHRAPRPPPRHRSPRHGPAPGADRGAAVVMAAAVRGPPRPPVPLDGDRLGASVRGRPAAFERRRMTMPMATKPGDQPSTPKHRRFRDTALASGLVTAADLDAAEAVAGDRLGAAEPATGDAAGCRQLDVATARTLVEQGKLTPFQAREIQAGRTRFRLGQYTVIDEVGRGGMGQVFEAEHALMGRRVAVKVLPRSKATPESEAAFRREMRILGRLDHENLVRAFDAGYDAMVYYLVTELVPGMDLRRLVRKRGPLDEVATASVFSQVARGLAFAHAQRLVHRDVKPGNILVMEDGRVKVLDLGLAGSTLEAEAVRLGRVVGTMDYIAPEQIRTPDDVGPPADIYALGCSMYFALTGDVPFPGGSRKDKMRRHLTESPVPIQRVAPHVPQPLCLLVEAMMAKAVADRVGSAEDVIRRLARWTPERPVPVPPRSVADGAIVRGDHDARADSSGGTQGQSASSLEFDPGLPGGSRQAWREAVAGFQAVLQDTIGMPGMSRAVKTAVKVLVPAALAGVGFAVAMSLVRGIDVAAFDKLLGAVTPATCGWAAFLFMVAVQAAAQAGRRRR